MQNQHSANLLALQPQMRIQDYASAEAFYQRLAASLEKAKKQGKLGPRTIGVFPEYIGAWLLALEEDLEKESKLLQAVLKLIGHHPLSFPYYMLLSYSPKQPIFEACFRLKSELMAEVYFNTFSRLAKQFEITLVAGSIVLPQSEIKRGKLVIHPGSLWERTPLENIALVFRPDGTPYTSIVKKVFLTSEENGFTQSAALESLPVFDTPAGKLGVLICADSWFPQAYKVLEQKGAELVAVGAMITDQQVKTDKWKGYDATCPPATGWEQQVGQITHAKAWQRFTLEQGMTPTSIRYGIISFLRGQIFDVVSTGLSISYGNPSLKNSTQVLELLNLEIKS